MGEEQKERTPWVRTPCKGCERRTKDCHGQCEDYAKYREFVALRKAGYKQYVADLEPTEARKKKLRRNRPQ